MAKDRKYYCGINKIPKKKRRGTMKECVMDSQVRYYGIKKVDKRLIDASKRLKKKMSKKDISIKIAKLKGQKKRMNKKLKIEEKKKKKKK
uniref:Uncharacterized protein n=1 Tax=Mimivirus LCMiAC02 TaxID=2506609 RepID=A0A481Z233_9VIRU|nr:MAG: uncharacterized protein LCMiAC02_01980 [Mimivirus LCMiAC02]